MTKETTKIKENERSIHMIDADGEVMGRLATQVAILLRGKHRANFVPYKDMGEPVTVFNIDKMRITGKKEAQKTYWRHTGYLGNTKFETLGKSLQKDSGKLFQRVVFGMLPKNKLRSRMIKKLKVHAGEIK